MAGVASCFISSKGNVTHLSDEQKQENRVSDPLLWFEPLVIIVTLDLETSCVPYGRPISRGIRIASLRGKPSGVCVLRGGTRVIRDLVVTTTHGESG